MFGSFASPPTTPPRPCTGYRRQPAGPRHDAGAQRPRHQQGRRLLQGRAGHEGCPLPPLTVRFRSRGFTFLDVVVVCCCFWQCTTAPSHSQTETHRHTHTHSAPESIYEPKQPKGSLYLAYNPDGFGVLLLPYKPPARGLPKTVRPGGVVDKLAIVTDGVLDLVNPDDQTLPGGAAVKYAGPAPGIGTRVAVTQDPNGVGVVLVEYGDLEKELEGTKISWQ